MTPIERRRLTSRHDDMQAFVKADDRDGYAAANTTFHSAIYQLLAGSRSPGPSS